MKEQKVVRTYPTSWINPTKNLQDLLYNGYHVVMCNKITNKDGSKILEYIVERKE